MTYVEPNYQTKKALREAVKAGVYVTVFEPGPFPFRLTQDGRANVEGPHYPQPHRWYAVVEVNEDRIVTRVVS
jgi:hypothetical protein